MKNMEFLAMIFIILATLSMSSCIQSHSSTAPTHPKVPNRSDLVLPLYHGNHPKLKSHFQKLKPLSVAPVQKYKAELLFYMEFLVGTPAESAISTFDTGSRFSWFKYDRRDPSTTYRPVPCRGYECEDVPSSQCSAVTQTCLYQLEYGDGTTSAGVVGSDNFYIFKANQTGHHDPSSKVQFEMAYGTPRDKGTSSRHTGVIGALGMRYELGVSRFSVCFPKPPKKDSYARFGTDTFLWGEITPLVPPLDHMKFKVDSITIAGFLVTNLTREAESGGVFIFDTGAALTQLHPFAMDNVVDRVKKSIHALPATQYTPDGSELCYHRADRPSYSTLEFTFNLAGNGPYRGGSLHFTYRNLWIGYSVCNCDCLAFMRSTKDKSIFGVTQMRGFNFGFDVDRRMLSYEEDDCTLP